MDYIENPSNSNWNHYESLNLDTLPVDLFGNEQLESGVLPSAPQVYVADPSQHNEGLTELDAHELETLLTNPELATKNGISTPDTIGSNVISSNNFSLDFSSRLPDIPHQFQSSIEVASNDENQPEVEKKQKKKAERSSILVISVPSPMQESLTLKSLPTVQLDSTTINQINTASSGYAGVFIPPSNQIRRNIIRRPPLQVVERIQQPVSPDPAVNVSSNKRKQKFQLTRDDSISFLGNSPPKPAKKLRSTPSPEAYANATNGLEVAEVVAAAIELDPNRCPGCKKVFKNMSAHKCKKSLVPGLERVVTVLTLKCSVCNETFDRREDYYEHTNSHNMLFCACCEMAFKTVEDLKNHLITVVTKKDVGKKIQKVEVITEKKATKEVEKNENKDVEQAVSMAEPKKEYKRAAKKIYCPEAKKSVPAPKKRDVAKEAPTVVNNNQESNIIEKKSGKVAAKKVKGPTVNKLGYKASSSLMSKTRRVQEETQRTTRSHAKK